MPSLLNVPGLLVDFSDAPSEPNLRISPFQSSRLPLAVSWSSYFDWNQASIQLLAQCFSTRGDFAVQETFGKVCRYFHWSQLESWYWRGLGRGQGCHCTFAKHRAALKMNFLAQNAKDTKVEKLLCPVDHSDLCKPQTSSFNMTTCPLNMHCFSPAFLPLLLLFSV